MSAIQLRCKVFPGAFLLYLFKPRISLDGMPDQQCRWGEQTIPVQPGRHHLRVWYNYITGPTNMGEAVVDVPPGRPVSVVYKTRWMIFLPGKVEVAGQVAPGQAAPYGHAAQQPQMAQHAPMPPQQHAPQPVAGARPAAAPWAAGAPSAAGQPGQGGQPAGWHPDPTGRHEHRWWDGRQWTPAVSTRGVSATDPI